MPLHRIPSKPTRAGEFRTMKRETHTHTVSLPKPCTQTWVWINLFSYFPFPPPVSIYSNATGRDKDAPRKRHRQRGGYAVRARCPRCVCACCRFGPELGQAVVPCVETKKGEKRETGGATRDHRRETKE